MNLRLFGPFAVVFPGAPGLALLTLLLVPLSPLGMSAATADQQPPATIAGKSVAQYTAEVASNDRVVRLRAVKSLGAFGNAAAKPLNEALEHSDAAVRYTAAVALGRIGGEGLAAADKPLNKLFKDDASQAVRTAAAYALVAGNAKPVPDKADAKDADDDQASNALRFLTDRLEYPDRGTVCSTAELLSFLGPKASAAVPELKKVYAANKAGGKGDYHIGGATKNALRKIVPGWDG